MQATSASVISESRTTSASTGPALDSAVAALLTDASFGSTRLDLAAVQDGSRSRLPTMVGQQHHIAGTSVDTCVQAGYHSKIWC
jgi:hypothetical protein